MARSKKEQTQLLALMLIVVSGLLFAGVHFGLVPFLKTKKKNLSKIEELNAQIQTMRDVIRDRSKIQTESVIKKENLRKAMQYIPEPVLGNYLLNMESVIKEAAAGLDLTLNDIKEGEKILIKHSDNLCQIRSANIAASGSYHDLIVFVDRLEANPLLTIMALNITAKPNTPTRHELRVVSGWITWVAPESLPEYIAKRDDHDAT